uniref:Uncharacterized protein n=1 Tax=Panagrellus redivivus TaxID=6233 RepID=A0A7E5A251_PANRE
MPCDPGMGPPPPSIVIAINEPESGSARSDPSDSNGNDANGDKYAVDYESLLLYPVLPPNPHFFCCHGRYHITAVSKVLALIYVVVYLMFCIFIYLAGIPVTVLFALFFMGSVALSTLYGVFRWKKLCLIPFFLLQIIIILNIAVLMVFLFYSLFVTDDGHSLGRVHHAFDGVKPFSSISWICIILYGLFILEVFFVYSIKVMLYEYEFIQSVDKFLKTLKRSSSNHSKDGLDATMTTPRMLL